MYTKRYKTNKLSVGSQSFTLKTAVNFFLEKYLPAKFDETVELILVFNRTSIKLSSKSIKSSVLLPNAISKVKVAAIISSNLYHKAKKAGATLIGSDLLLNDIRKGKIDFDCYVITPDFVVEMSNIIKVLGTKIPVLHKQNIVSSDNIEEKISILKTSSISYSMDRNYIIHVGVAKLSSGQVKVLENINSVITSIKNIASISRDSIDKSYLSVTQGPSIKLDLKIF